MELLETFHTDTAIFPRITDNWIGPATNRIGVSPATKLVRYHQRWLSRMLKSRRQPPRIPVRRVTEGGFAFLAARPEGRLLAETWWEQALDRVEV